ncbi:MAG: YceI family protein [Ferruginibacter sp.]
MKKAILSLALVLATGLLFAQKKTTTSAVISFDATTSLDKLPKADNKTVIAAFDPKTGKLAFEATVKSFTFSNPRIQEHFNGAGWMDSEKFPTANFAGTISNLKDVKFNKDGVYKVTVNGDLTIHGVTKPVETTGTVTVNAGAIKTESNFSIKLEDYGVNGPAIGAGKVAKEPVITVTAEF